MDQLKYWLALSRAPYIGPVNFRAILNIAESPKYFFDNFNEIKQHVKLNERSLNYLNNPDWQAIDIELEWTQSGNNSIITLNDPRYPQLLKEISDAPPFLYVHGNANILNSTQLAIVGSRNPSKSGQQNAFRFAEFLAKNNFSISSGLALGIDYQSHRGALAAKGKTIAVIGTGLNRVYPAKHRDLAHEIADSGGALVSEYALDTPARKENFPRRNRIISGMSLGTLVIEAAQKSGSLITARLAAEQGREVFAIPGSIHNPLAKGCHALIRQGAKLVETAEDILEELGHTIQHHSTNTGIETSKEINILDPELKDLLEILGFEPITIDEIVRQSGLTPEGVSSMLLVLELQDYVESLPGGAYSRIK